ncbi:MAG TPA: GNAT family N-acetyltransferase [Chthonomonadales bacterium]|nr:GNAT family N-acetyltransferase [Chthonomonadales bacterium]
MIIRPAKPEDVEHIAWIVRESYRFIPDHHTPVEMPLYHPEHHAERMKDPGTRWAVLCEQGLPVGVAMWRMLPGLAHLHMLFVAGEWQGKGYGVRLLHHHQKEACREQRDTRIFTLHCLRKAYWAMRFYSHQGYRLYEPGDEGRVTDLYLWIDACRRHDNSWPLRADKALFYKTVR